MEAKLSIRELRIDHWKAERQAGRQADGGWRRRRKRRTEKWLLR